MCDTHAFTGKPEGPSSSPNHHTTSAAAEIISVVIIRSSRLLQKRYRFPAFETLPRDAAICVERRAHVVHQH